MGLHFLGKAAAASATGTYQMVVNEICGPSFGKLSMTFIMLYTYGCCITFQIVLGDQLEKVFEVLFTNADDLWYLDRRLIITVNALLFIFPLCIPKVKTSTIFKFEVNLKFFFR